MEKQKRVRHITLSPTEANLISMISWSTIEVAKELLEKAKNTRKMSRVGVKVAERLIKEKKNLNYRRPATLIR